MRYLYITQEMQYKAIEANLCQVLLRLLRLLRLFFNSNLDSAIFRGHISKASYST